MSERTPIPAVPRQPIGETIREKTGEVLTLAVDRARLTLNGLHASVTARRLSRTEESIPELEETARVLRGPEKNDKGKYIRPENYLPTNLAEHRQSEGVVKLSKKHTKQMQRRHRLGAIHKGRDIGGDRFTSDMGASGLPAWQKEKAHRDKKKYDKAAAKQDKIDTKLDDIGEGRDRRGRKVARRIERQERRADSLDTRLTGLEMGRVVLAQAMENNRQSAQDARDRRVQQRADRKDWRIRNRAAKKHAKGVAKVRITKRGGTSP